jgi:hypothetical protein
MNLAVGGRRGTDITARGAVPLPTEHFAHAVAILVDECKNRILSVSPVAARVPGTRRLERTVQNVSQLPRKLRVGEWLGQQMHAGVETPDLPAFFGSLMT